MREYSFNLEAARRYGVDGATLLQGMAMWITKNRANDRHFHDGRWWTYNSQEALAKLFPFWSRRQIQRIVKGLNEAGALLLGQYSEGSQHNTTWFALSDDVLRLLGAEECASLSAAAGTGDDLSAAAAAPPLSGEAGTTAPNGAVPESTAPNGAVYRTERCSTLAGASQESDTRQIDTTSTPYSPPAGGGSMLAEFSYVCQAWYHHDGGLPVMDRDATFTEYLKARQTSNFLPLKEGLEAWVTALGPARLPLRRVLAGETWREDPFFWLFWQGYPRKIDKDRARRAWKKLKPDRALAKTILEALRRWKLCDQWQEERFIPHPATWLNGRRWEASPPGMGRRAPEEPPEREVEEWT